MRARLPSILFVFVALNLLVIMILIIEDSNPGTESSHISLFAAASTPTPTPRSNLNPTQTPPRRSLVAPTPAPTSIPESARKDLPYYNQNILLWPKSVGAFKNEYSSWQLWLASESTSSYAIRDELLITVRAFAAIIPSLDIKTDEPNSDIISISGNPASVGALLERLRDYPLLERFTEDSTEADQTRKHTTCAATLPQSKYPHALGQQCRLGLWQAKHSYSRYTYSKHISRPDNHDNSRPFRAVLCLPNMGNS
jgi:hypothetical protein